jgi:hypothetical protein
MRPSRGHAPMGFLSPKGFSSLFRNLPAALACRDKLKERQRPSKDWVSARFRAWRPSWQRQLRGATDGEIVIVVALLVVALIVVALIGFGTAGLAAGLTTRRRAATGGTGLHGGRRWPAGAVRELAPT